MAIRLQVADRAGVLLGELEADVGPVSWRLNDVGQAPIAVALTDPKAAEDYFRFGNRALIEFDNGLPLWGGTFEPDRDWDGETVRVTLRSAEHVLSFAQTDRGRYFSGASVGQIFTALVTEAVAAGDIAVEIGHVWTGGDGHSPDYHYKTLLAIVQDSLCRRLSLADFMLRPELRDGRVAFVAELHERRGQDKQGKVALIEGHNLAIGRMREQGPIRNSIIVVGGGVGWGSDRPVSFNGVPLEDAESVATYGRRVYTEVSGITVEQATLDAAARLQLERYAWPRRKWDVTVIDLAPAAFSAYDVGDTVRLQAASHGFGGVETAVRVLAREFNPTTRQCKLVIEELSPAAIEET